VRGDAGVERAMPRAGHEIGAGLEIGVHGWRLGRRWTPDQVRGDEIGSNRMLLFGSPS
jgi:hypothetical protein